MQYVKKKFQCKIVPWHIIYEAGKINNGNNFHYTDEPVVKMIDKVIIPEKRIEVKKVEAKQQEPLIVKKEVPVVETKQHHKEKNINSNYNIRGFVCFPVKTLSTNNT